VLWDKLHNCVGWHAHTIFFVRGRGDTGGPEEEPDELCLLLGFPSSSIFELYFVEQLVDVSVKKALQHPEKYQTHYITQIMY